MYEGALSPNWYTEYRFMPAEFRNDLSLMGSAQRNNLLRGYLGNYQVYGPQGSAPDAKMMAFKNSQYSQIAEGITSHARHHAKGGFFGSGIGKILGAVLPIAASFIPGIGPLAAAGIGAGAGYLTGGNAQSAILGAVMGGGGKLLSGASGLSGLSSTVGKIADIAGPIGKILGVVNSFSGEPGGQKYVIENNNIIPETAQAPPFNPVRPAAMTAPASLSELSSYAPEQVRSSLATKGLNSGLGSEESDYYKNLLQRSLIGDGNKVQTDNPNFLMPIESQYFSQQGINTNDPTEFLKGIS